MEESSAISPVLEKMEEQVYTTKHLVSYRTILSMEANHHEATLQLTVVLLLPQEEVQCFALLSEVCWGDSLLMWGRVV